MIRTSSQRKPNHVSSSCNPFIRARIQRVYVRLGIYYALCVSYARDKSMCFLGEEKCAPHLIQGAASASVIWSAHFVITSEKKKEMKNNNIWCATTVTHVDDSAVYLFHLMIRDSHSALGFFQDCKKWFIRFVFKETKLELKLLTNTENSFAHMKRDKTLSAISDRLYLLLVLLESF